MNSKSFLRWVLLSGLLLVVHPFLLLAQDAGDTIIKRGTIHDDLYLAGGNVKVLAEVEGDVVAAGGRVTVARLVKGDVIVAGGFIDVSGRVLDDVRATGGFVVLDGQIRGDAIAAGGKVTVAPATTIGGRAWLAGGDVEVAGRVERGLKAAAGTITISGQVEGDVELIASEIEVLSTARIEGNLTYRSPLEARIDAGAQIGGTVTHTEVELPELPITTIVWTFRVLLFIGLMVAGVVLFLVFPRLTVAAAETIGTDPWISLGLGFTLFVCTPVVGVLLMATLVGVPLALALIALYLVAILVGFLTAAFFLGDMGVRLLARAPELSKGGRILSLIGALTLLAIIRLIPIAGSVVLFVVLLFGLGAWGLQAYRAYAGARSSPDYSRRDSVQE